MSNRRQGSSNWLVPFRQFSQSNRGRGRGGSARGRGRGGNPQPRGRSLQQVGGNNTPIRSRSTSRTRTSRSLFSEGFSVTSNGFPADPRQLIGNGERKLVSGSFSLTADQLKSKLPDIPSGYTKFKITRIALKLIPRTDGVMCFAFVGFDDNSNVSHWVDNEVKDWMVRFDISEKFERTFTFPSGRFDLRCGDNGPAIMVFCDVAQSSHGFDVGTEMCRMQFVVEGYCEV